MRLLPLLLLLLACCAKAAPPKQVDSYCREQAFQGSRFTVCDNKGGDLQLYAASKLEAPVRSFAELMRKVDPDRVAFAMNAGMFDEQGRPIGLAQRQGMQIHRVNLRGGPGNFHMKPNGVFIVTCGGKAAMIAQSDAIPLFRCDPQLMTQSGPILVVGGKLHPKLEPDGQSRLIRNGVGVTAQGKPLFVISESAVSLGKFARFFRDALKTPNALYFDGSVSSLWDPASGRQDSHAELGPILVAFKPEASKPDRAAHAKP
jgi:uncharacterized protein YigE (DUF2233 family)